MNQPPTKKQLRHEIALLRRRVRAPLSEFLDAHAVIGCRAGSGELLFFGASRTPAEKRAIEDAVLCVAASIVRSRKKRRRT